jgi:hypothetical protein
MSLYKPLRERELDKEKDEAINWFTINNQNYQDRFKY